MHSFALWTKTASVCEVPARLRPRSGLQLSTNLILTLALALCAFCANTRAAELEANVDRAEVQVADPLQLSISAISPQGTDVTFPPVPESLGSFQVISHQDFFDIPLDGDATQRLWKRVIQLETYESGILEIPAMSVFVGREARTTDPIRVTVQSLLEPTADPTKFRELKDVEEIELAKPNWLLWSLLGVGALALIGAIAWYAIRKYKSQQSAEAWAYERLDDLASSTEYALHDQTRVLPRAADILRAYIQRRFDIAATQLTTDEFLARIQFSPELGEDQRSDLQEFLRHADEVKFAHLVPESDQLSATLDRVRKFVARNSEHTKSKPIDKASADTGPVGGTDHVVAR